MKLKISKQTKKFILYLFDKDQVFCGKTKVQRGVKAL